jgi:hypothetical protein
LNARALLLRRNWIPGGVCVALAIGGVVATYGGLVWGILPAIFGTIFAPVVFARNAFPRATPTVVRASQTGVAIDGREPIEADDIVEAKLLPRWGDAIVELTHRKGRTALRLALADAQALVAALGARRTQFRLIVPFWKRYLGWMVILGILYAIPSRGFDTWLLMMPGALLMAWPLAWLVGLLRGKLVIGTDGFTRQFAFLSRFIAFRDVASVTSARSFLRGSEDTIVALRSGKTLRLRAVDAPNTDEDRGAEPRAMLMHLTEAFTKSTHMLRSVDIRALVERGPRTAREWLNALDALARGQVQGYRAAVVTSEVLEEVALDPSATPSARVGAAAALLRVADEASRTRVRISAEACAEADLREALLAVADARSPEATENALGTLRATR